MKIKLISLEDTEKYFKNSNRKLNKLGTIFEASFHKITWIPAFYKDADGEIYASEDCEIIKEKEMNETDLNESTWCLKEPIVAGSPLWYSEQGIAGSFALAELERFQTDRLLHKNPFDLKVATMNILEELYEAHGIGDNKERLLAKNLYKLIEKNIETLKKYIKMGSDLNGITVEEPTVDMQVDAFCDMQVFAGGEVGKLGYKNEMCLLEVGKEINSREGTIINGKFEKFKTEEAMAKWYKANFDKCRLCI